MLGEEAAFADVPESFADAEIAEQVPLGGGKSERGGGAGELIVLLAICDARGAVGKEPGREPRRGREPTWSTGPRHQHDLRPRHVELRLRHRWQLGVD